MSNLPQIRWRVLLMAAAFAVIFLGVDYDFNAAIAHLGSKAAAIAVGGLAVAKLLAEFVRSIDEDDPTPDKNGYVYKMARAGSQPGLSFWRRVW